MENTSSNPPSLLTDDAAHRIWIAQLLCPARHAILAIPFDIAVTPVDQACQSLLQKFADWKAEGQLNPHCGICEAPEWSWHVEAGRTPWTTMDEAMPHIARLRAENLLAMLLIGGK